MLDRKRAADGPELYFNLDTVATASVPSVVSRRAAAKVRMLNATAHAYQLTMPLLACLAGLAFVLAGARSLRKPETRRGWVIQAGLLAIILTRLMMLSLIDITSFPAIDPLYLTSAYPLLILFVFLALEGGAHLWAERRANAPTATG